MPIDAHSKRSVKLVLETPTVSYRTKKASTIIEIIDNSTLLGDDSHAHWTRKKMAQRLNHNSADDEAILVVEPATLEDTRTFPERVYDMVCIEDNEAHGLMGWEDDGKKFSVARDSVLFPALLEKHLGSKILCRCVVLWAVDKDPQQSRNSNTPRLLTTTKRGRQKRI